MATESAQPTEKKKKGRKRVKAILAKIKDQMEFYFSDSNLHKDRFLKKAIEATTDGYIDLSTFLQFNRIKALTDEVKMIADAVAYKSELLQVNEDRTKVKRIKPLSEQKNVDSRTVYVEYLPMSADHEWVKKVFSVCGKVAYVSLPKFRTTGDLKGFGFVEFETEDAAKLACEELNNPPVEATPRIGMFPKSNKPLEALRKKLPEDQILETEEKVKMEIQTETDSISDNKDITKQPRTDETLDTETSPVTGGILVKRVKRTRTKSEGSVDDSFSGNDSSPQKRKRHEVSFDLPEESEKGAGGGKKRSRKRKNRAKTVDVATISHDSEKSEKESLSQNKSDLEEMPEKKRKVDTASDREKNEPDSEQGPEKKTPDHVRSETKKDSDSLGGKKRKIDSTSKSETDVKEPDERHQKKRRKDSNRESSVSQSESETESKKKAESKTEVGNEVITKKKKHSRRRKQHKQKEVPELRVIPKSEWLCLREEYLRLQKASMTMLKRTLAEMKDKSNTASTKEDEKKQRKEIEFVPDVIVKVVSEKPLVRKKLKNDLGGEVAIAYIDVTDGLCEGHIRCNDAGSAKQIQSEDIEGHIFTILSGDDEKLYWEKLTSDRGNKLSGKTRRKKRGHEKWMDKAQKASVENVERQHIVFDDE